VPTQIAEVSAMDGNLHLPTSSRFAQIGQKRGLPNNRKVVFLDRDGVLNEEIGYLSSPEQLIILDGVASAITRLQEHFYLVVTTNQSAIARGYFVEDDLLLIHRHLVGRLEEQNAYLDALYYCPHLSGGTVPSFTLPCDCRKPEPGMILRAQRDWDLELAGSYMVGDQPTDVAAGTNAGVTGILVGNSDSEALGEDLSALDLPSAVTLILAHSGLT
jgi:D-glycero-D-manno-heptose 1,7-bisphosphate phosphatase